MSWIVYGICGIIVVLAIIILIREISKMVKGRCCESCKHCSVKNGCDACHGEKSAGDHSHKSNANLSH